MAAEDKEEKNGGKLTSVIIVLVIILVWLLIFGVLIKFDVGGFGSGVLYPVLKDVPIVNMLLPDVNDDNANKLYYLYNNAHDYYWSLSYSYFYGSDFSRNVAFYVYSNGSLNYNCISREDTCNLGAVRPAVILATGTQITGGDGTIGNPYKILED